MLFNSFPFIFAFLPVTLVGFFTVSRYRQVYGAAWLTLASLTFYAVWDPRYLPLLLGSIGFNFLAGRNLARLGSYNKGKWLLTVAITVNLALLGYFKYAGFFTENLGIVLDRPIAILRVILPLGISFFTFTQIAYLVDAWRGKANEPSLLHYMLFVTYFPHLIAGPILHHAEMMPQFRIAATYRFSWERLAAGLVMFSLGLFKKVVLADGVSQFVAPVFNAAEAGIVPGLPDSWGGALAYTFQLYYDFSGYCDMAIGLSWMIGIALPLNFSSPYKAISIVEFWRRWHMTLSRFLRDYLYIPLGGNRHGPMRRYINLFATMAIGGLWHGAGWTFVAWGALHGAYLIVNHAWDAVKPRLRWKLPPRQAAMAGWFVTFMAVVVGWVVFRSHSIGGAGRILSGMIGANAVTGAPMLPAMVWIWCASLATIALFMPNSQEIMRRHLGGIARPAEAAVHRLALPLVFQRSIPWAVAVALVLAAGTIDLPQPTSFLYFNF